MNVDELQARFNELRGKKFRTIADKRPITFAGFYAGGYGPCIFVEITYPTFSKKIEIDPMSLGERFKTRPIIEEVSPYTDWPIDAKVLVWNEGGSLKYKRYFAGVDQNGKPLAWDDGTTSWTNTTKIAWDYAELVED